MTGIIIAIIIAISLSIWLYFDSKNMTVRCYHCGKEILVREAKKEYYTADWEASYYHLICDYCYKEAK